MVELGLSPVPEGGGIVRARTSVNAATAEMKNEQNASHHSAIVRLTHWTAVLSVLGLLVTGIGILISHPRLYWGEVGNVGTESVVDLPIPFTIGPSVWNRPFHFLFAWMLVLTGVVYVAAAVLTRHLRDDLLPARADLRLSHLLRVIAEHVRWQQRATNAVVSYNVVQRLTYLAVVFVVFPAIIWTGLAMSFGVTSVVPVLATALGGHQSARTLHFVCVLLLLLFAIVHVAMLGRNGFWTNVRAMITGFTPPGGKLR